MLCRHVAQNRSALQKLGITHVLNAAHSKRGSIGDQRFYGNDIVYCGIPADDSTYFDIDVYFKPAADFIRKALKSPDGKAPQGAWFATMDEWVISITAQPLMDAMRTLFKTALDGRLTSGH